MGHTKEATGIIFREWEPAAPPQIKIMREDGGSRCFRGGPLKLREVDYRTLLSDARGGLGQPP